MAGLELDPVLLARLQFAFTISFHIVFPAFTIGLASWLAVVDEDGRYAGTISNASITEHLHSARKKGRQRETA